MAELADAADSKSAGTWYLGGSTPPPGTSLIRASRWWTKTEDTVIQTVHDAKAEFELLRTNHLHHIQQSLDEIKAGGQQHYINEEAHQVALIQAINGSKDAIVNALLAVQKK